MKEKVDIIFLEEAHDYLKRLHKQTREERLWLALTHL